MTIALIIASVVVAPVLTKQWRQGHPLQLERGGGRAAGPAQRNVGIKSTVGSSQDASPAPASAAGQPAPDALQGSLAEPPATPLPASSSAIPPPSPPPAIAAPDPDDGWTIAGCLPGGLFSFASGDARLGLAALLLQLALVGLLAYSY